MKKNEKVGALCVILAGICWGLIGIFTRRLSRAGLDSMQITFLRNLFAATVLFVFLLFKDRKSFIIHLKDIWMFIGTGICSIAFFNICYFKAIEMTSLSVAAVLLYMAPAMVMIMSCIFFKEKITGKKIIALLFAFVGCIFTTGIISAESSISGIGFLIGLGSGFGYALYSIFGFIAIKKYNTFTITLYTFIIAAVGLIPLSKPLEQIEIIKGNLGMLIIVILLATISTVIPFIAYTVGLKYMEAGKASIMAFIEPMVATICGILIFQETIHTMNIIGIILIFVSVLLLNMKGGSNDKAIQETN